MGTGYETWHGLLGYGSGIAVSCGVGMRHASDPVLLWLCHRPAGAAWTRPLAWNSPQAPMQPTQNGKEKNAIEFAERKDVQTFTK